MKPLTPEERQIMAGIYKASGLRPIRVSTAAAKRYRKRDKA